MQQKLKNMFIDQFKLNTISVMVIGGVWASVIMSCMKRWSRNNRNSLLSSMFIRWENYRSIMIIDVWSYVNVTPTWSSHFKWINDN